MTNVIEKRIVLKAPVDRVWRALTDAEEFGRWFRVKIEGPFVVGEVSPGRITYPGYEHLVWEATVIAIEPQRRFAFAWHPYAVDPVADYSGEPPTLVEFVLEPVESGTALTVTESGFDRIPAYRRDEAFLRNDGGWAEQMRNIRAHVES